ncbi:MULTISPECIES: hypothetical protein [unclassified Crossiella]|uniref:hypothetical protein n=1 Tax=unclassified Crossiella TaxID=2620835 RepID=UPI001FFF1D68|nr:MULTISPECIES: hypothetical protein [unclassified Crossiella]MCK2240125.1 hypothetical protein [Crossiella sp. S99.2]MCK2253423.1 hypothetical protein [Crossiella sp. S99.1]
MPSRRERQSLERIRATIYNQPRHATWRQSGVPYAATLKGTSVLKFKGGDIYRRLLGCSRAEYDLLQPLVVQWLALVYQGDEIYEDAQASGQSSAEGGWKQRMRDIAEGHGLYEPAVGKEIDELERYYILEGQILLGEVELTDEVLQDVLRIRSSDFFSLLGVVFRARGERCTPDYEALLRSLWLLGEINDDLTSYAEDVAANSFNTLRLMVWRHGASGAVAGLRALQNKAIADLLGGIRTAGRDALVRMVSGSEVLPLEHTTGLLRLLPTGVLRALAGTLVRIEMDMLRKIPVPAPIAESGPLVAATS